MRRLDPELRLRAASFLSSFDRFTIPPLIVPIHRDFGISLGHAAVLASAYFVTYGVSQPLWGALSDRVGRAAVLRFAVLAGGLASVVATVAPGFAVLLVARTLAGLFFAAVVPTAITYLGDTVADARRQHALVLLMASATSGLAIATVASGVAAEVVGWRAAFGASAVVSVVVTVVLWRLPEPAVDRGSGSLAARVRSVLAQRWVLVVVGLAFLEGSVIFGSLTFVAASLQQDGVSASLAGSAAAGFGLANLLCTPLVTRAITRVSSPRLIGGGAAMAAAGLTLAAVGSTVATAVVATLALGAGFGFLHSTLQLWATQVHPEARALSVSLFASAIFVGGAAASAAAAPLADADRFALIFALSAVLAGVLAVAGATLRARYVVQEEGPSREATAVAL
ncbi:MAG TPA: MFS transporter [Solirubrobacteraceae bacterium]|jgi:predicted MFS family arabinose efflux permease